MFRTELPPDSTPLYRVPYPAPGLVLIPQTLLDAVRQVPNLKLTYLSHYDTQIVEAVKKELKAYDDTK